MTLGCNILPAGHPCGLIAIQCQLCRMQLVPSFPRGFCFIEGSFDQVTDGASGLTVEKRRRKKGKLNYLTMGELLYDGGAQMVPLSQAPKIYSGKETEIAFC